MKSDAEIPQVETSTSYCGKKRGPKPKEYKCNFCGKITIGKMKFMKHLKNIHDCLVFEDGISENFREKSLLDELDSSNERTETPETLVNCPACPSKLTQEDFKKHFRIHSKNFGIFECKECKAKGSQKQNYYIKI